MLRKLIAKLLSPILSHQIEMESSLKQMLEQQNRKISQMSASLSTLTIAPNVVSSVNHPKDSIAEDNFYEFCLMQRKAILLSGIKYQDVQLLNKYVDRTVVGKPGYYAAFMGVYISREVHPHIDESLIGTIYCDIPIPAHIHAETIEYVSLLDAVENSDGDSFVMFEIGSGWGPWVTFAAKAWKMRGGGEITVVAVEGQKNKIPLVRQILHDNDFRNNTDDLEQTYNGVHTKIIHGVVMEKDGTVDFEIVPIHSYDASVLGNMELENKQYDKVPCYSCDTLMKDYDVVDLIHIDIQGYEVNVIESAIDVLNKKVRYMIIGTHSRKIEGDLFNFLLSNGWELLRESPCTFEHLTVDEIASTHWDGTQFWENTRI